MKRECQGVVARPPRLVARVDASLHVTESGFVRGRRLRLSSRSQVQTGQRDALLGALDQGAADVQVVDDLEQPILRNHGTALGEQLPADAEMDRRPLLFWNQ